MLKVMGELNLALGHVVGAAGKRANMEQSPEPDLVVYYIEHAEWAISEALQVLAKEKEEPCKS